MHEHLRDGAYSSETAVVDESRLDLVSYGVEFRAEGFDPTHRFGRYLPFFGEFLYLTDEFGSRDSVQKRF